MKARFLQPAPAADYVPEEQTTIIDGIRHWKTGEIVDHPDAWKLVHGGIAEAADDECEAAAKERGNPKTAGWMAKGPVRIMREFVEYKAEQQADEDDPLATL